MLDPHTIGAPILERPENPPKAAARNYATAPVLEPDVVELYSNNTITRMES